MAESESSRRWGQVAAPAKPPAAAAAVTHGHAAPPAQRQRLQTPETAAPQHRQEGINRSENESAPVPPCPCWGGPWPCLSWPRLAAARETDERSRTAQCVSSVRPTRTSAPPSPSRAAAAG